MHFRHSRPAYSRSFKGYFQCSLEFDSNFDGLTCTSKALATRNPFADVELASYARSLLDLLPGMRDPSATEKVRSMILLLIPEGQATAERAADCLGLPVRTLQRRLIGEGTGFSQLLDETRRELVVRYLFNTAQPIGVIAHLMGYSSISAFTRWFTSAFGMPPIRWRKMHRPGEVADTADVIVPVEAEAISA